MQLAHSSPTGARVAETWPPHCHQCLATCAWGVERVCVCARVCVRSRQGINSNHALTARFNSWHTPLTNHSPYPGTPATEQQDTHCIGVCPTAPHRCVCVCVCVCACACVCACSRVCVHVCVLQHWCVGVGVQMILQISGGCKLMSCPCCPAEGRPASMIVL